MSENFEQQPKNLLGSEKAAKPFSLNDYLMAFRDAEGNGLPEGKSGHKSSFPLAKRIVCKDGFSLSVQASHGGYCSPRDNFGPWWAVEVGFPSAKPEFISHLAEDCGRYTETVYPYADLDLVEQLIALHGGPDEQTLQASVDARKVTQGA